MATLSSDKTYVTVVKGDTLSEIARDYSSYSGGATYQQLAAINNISNPDYIIIGQKIYLVSSAVTTSKTSSSSSAVTIDLFGLQSNADNVLFVTWTWNKTHTDHYEVQWSYSTGDGVYFIAGDSTTKYKQHTYSIPSNATKVMVKIKPVSETYTKNNTETSYWTGSWSSSKLWTVKNPPVKPSTPSVKMEDFKLTASLDNIDISNKATYIEFQVVKDNRSTAFSSQQVKITSNHASHEFTVQAGGEYKVRARAYSSTNQLYSEWSDYSANEGTIPAATSGITSIKATSKTSIYLEWGAVNNAETYDIEYATKQSYFDGSDQTMTISSIESTHYEKTGLESGQTYYFRVRAVNDNGHSGWSSIKSIVIGSEPTAPTTWSSTTTATVGEEVKLYWVHNAEDGSSETYAELEVYIDGTQTTYTIKNTETDEDKKDQTKFYTINTSKYVEGTQIQWRVRTAGVTLAYGDWSVQRTIDIYAPVTLELSVTNLDGASFDTLTSFPFYIYALAGPNTQTPIGYHLEITSNEVYETVDNAGNVKMVNAGEAVYSKYFDTTGSLLVSMTPGNINLDNNISYTVKCVVSMNSGLTAESTVKFDVAWTDVSYSPNAEIGIDSDTLVAHIRPYCEELTLTRYKVTKSGTTYTKTTEVISGGVYGTVVNNYTTTTGETIYYGTTDAGKVLYYCEIITSSLVKDVTLSLYRREFDGSFVELATGLQNTDCTFVTDPHPALDYARYRVVAVDNATGATSYYDVPGYPTGVTDIIIQWDEAWSNFDVTNNDEMQEPPWSGSMLRLPYDVDVSESTSPDVTLVNYIGRSNPVSYYGTHIGRTATWNTNVVYDDKDTIYALRRLQNWLGDVYVREATGSGYWANIKVQFSQKHCDVYVPVTLTITRVEGGI